MQVAEGVDVEDEVHAGNGDEIEGAVEQAQDLAGMEQSRDDEYTSHDEEENGRR